MKLLVHQHPHLLLLRADISPFSTWPKFLLGITLAPYASALHHKAFELNIRGSMMLVFRSQRFPSSSVTMCRSQEIQCAKPVCPPKSQIQGTAYSPPLCNCSYHRGCLMETQTNNWNVVSIQVEKSTQPLDKMTAQ